MTAPTAEQIRTLAPDASAARAAEGLADPRRWSGSGRAEAAAWGLCQGSGAQPYQVAVDLDGPAYTCSCPSRKIPCKHALGLLFLLAGGSVPTTDPPPWASGWLESRATRAAGAATRAAERPTEVDEAARARRIERREAKVLAGIEELDRWLGDLMRRGLDSARSEGYRFWDAMGARLVDAQAAGLGRSVRGLGWAANAGEAWPHLLLEGAARLHLLTEAYRRADALPAPLRADVRSLVGWTTREEELATDDEVDDRWLVIGRRVDDSGQVMTARTFLLGEASGRLALHLAFGVDAAPPTVLALPGQAFRARLAFYPSATPLRAAVRPVIAFDGAVASLPGAVGVDEAVRRHAQRLAVNPFAGAWPVVLAGVTPLRRGERFVIRDGAGRALPVEAPAGGPRLLAVSGGHPVDLAGEWDGTALRPLGVLADGRLVGVDAPDGDVATFRDGDPAWGRLVSAALLGTERTGGTVPVPEPAEPLVADRSAERALLAAAGVLAVRRRAGRRPTADEGPLPEPAPLDPRPSLGAETARLVGLVVTEEPGLLREVLQLVRRSGRRVPDEWLPELLAHAARGDELGTAAGEVLGPRARWLVGALPSLPGAGIPADAVPPEDWAAAWEAADSRAARTSLLASFRRADPAAAREALARWLPALPGDERADAVEALATGLAPDDEPLLASALADRRADVRRAAADLLVRLPGSAHTQWLEARARPLLQVAGTLRRRLTATLPATDDPISELAGRPVGGYGERSWLLRRLIGHVRPTRWTEWLGADAATLVGRALHSDEARAVIDGWIEAAGRFGDATWLAALASDPRASQTASADLPRAIAALPRERRPAVVAAAAGSVDLLTLARLAATCPAPWPAPLADAVIEAGRPVASAPFPDPSLYELIRVASRGLPPDRADDLAQLASWNGQIRPALGGALDTISLRARIHEAFATLPPLPPEDEP